MTSLLRLSYGCNQWADVKGHKKMTKQDFTDTTEYNFPESSFEKYIKRDDATPQHEHWRYRPSYWRVIDYAVATDSLFRLGTDPYSNHKIISDAQDFLYQVNKYKEHSHHCWLDEKMNDREFRKDRELGCQDGYNL
jgi:hypothetical protein